jgi:hypothetical protein
MLPMLRGRLRAAVFALLLLAACPAAAQNGNGNGHANGHDTQPNAQSGGAQLLIHVQARDHIVRQLADNTALEQGMSTRAGDFRTLLGGDGGVNLQPLNSAITAERRRVEDLISNIRRLEGQSEPGAIATILERFDARFPPSFAAPFERIDAEFRRGMAELRGAVEGSARLENAELGRMASTFLTALARYQQNVTGGLTRIRDGNAFPSYIYEIVGADSFAAMANLAQAQRFAELYRGKLQEIEAQSRQLIAAHANDRAQLLQLFNGMTEMVQANLQRLQSAKGRSEEMMIHQAERNFGNNVNEGSFKWMLVIFGIAFVVLFIVPYLYRDAATSSIAGQILTSNFILQFCTVFILTASIVLLGIGRYIEKDQLPVLLAGISGYVLGQLGRSQRVSEEAKA